MPSTRSSTRRPPSAVAAAALLVALAGCPAQPSAPPPPVPTANRVAAAPPPAAPPSTAPAPMNASVAAPADPSAVARINGLTITRGELDEVLYRSHGLKLLSDLTLLDLAKQLLTKGGATLTEADVTAERDRFFKRTFADVPPDQVEKTYRQLQAQQHLTDAEFDLGFRTNAALRKWLRPQLAGQIKEDALRKAFSLIYGEQRAIADCAVQNVAEAAEAHRRLRAGEPFAQVVREMSVDRQSRDLPGDHAGELQPFTATTAAFPQPIVLATFGLPAVGAVSQDVITDGTRYHVIKLLAVVPPKLAKFEDVRESVREQVQDEVEQRAINDARKQLTQAAAANLEITDPTLRGEWDALIAAQQPKGAALTPGQVTGKMPTPPTSAPAVPVGPPAQ